MKLLTIAVPSYNASAYLGYCVESLATGGEQVEILIINDGSTDETQKIAEHYQEKYPSIVRAVYQENKGHGGAVNTGIQQATGLYFKVVDSDDWVDVRAYLKILEKLAELEKENQPVDALISNFVYEKEGVSHRKIMRYENIFPQNRVFTWKEVRRFPKGQYMMMHSLIYRTDLLRRSQLQLPEHTFYVDNLFVFVPLQYVETMYYLDVDFYRYLIGREDQSVNEKIMIKRIDQQLRVNKLLVEQFDMTSIQNDRLKAYLLNHIEITTVISSVLLNRAGTPEHIEKKEALWKYIETVNPLVFKEIRNGFMGQLMNLSGLPGRKLSNAAYRIAQKIYGFN